MKKKNIIVISISSILIILALIATITTVVLVNKDETVDITLNGNFETGKTMKIVNDEFLEKYNPKKIKLNLIINMDDIKIDFTDEFKKGLLSKEETKSKYNVPDYPEKINFLKPSRRHERHSFLSPLIQFYYLDTNKKNKIIYDKLNKYACIKFYFFDKKNNLKYYFEKDNLYSKKVQLSTYLLLDKEINNNFIFDYEISYGFNDSTGLNKIDNSGYNFVVEEHFENLNYNKISYELRRFNYEDNTLNYNTVFDYKKVYKFNLPFTNIKNTLYYK